MKNKYLDAANDLRAFIVEGVVTKAQADRLGAIVNLLDAAGRDLQRRSLLDEAESMGLLLDRNADYATKEATDRLYGHQGGRTMPFWEIIGYVKVRKLLNVKWHIGEDLDLTEYANAYIQRLSQSGAIVQSYEWDNPYFNISYTASAPIPFLPQTQPNDEPTDAERTEHLAALAEEERIGDFANDPDAEELSR